MSRGLLDLFSISKHIPKEKLLLYEEKIKMGIFNIRFSRPKSLNDIMEK